MTPSRLLDDAWNEVVEAVNWYESRVAGYGDRLLSSVDAALERIEQAPLSGSPVTHRLIKLDVRRVRVKTFPYALYYVPSPRVVVAFSHVRRRPGYWAHRLRDLE